VQSIAKACEGKVEDEMAKCAKAQEAKNECDKIAKCSDRAKEVKCGHNAGFMKNMCLDNYIEDAQCGDDATPSDPKVAAEFRGAKEVADDDFDLFDSTLLDLAEDTEPKLDVCNVQSIAKACEGKVEDEMANCAKAQESKNECDKIAKCSDRAKEVKCGHNSGFMKNMCLDNYIEDAQCEADAALLDLAEEAGEGGSTLTGTPFGHLAGGKTTTATFSATPKTALGGLLAGAKKDSDATPKSPLGGLLAGAKKDSDTSEADAALLDLAKSAGDTNVVVGDWAKRKVTTSEADKEEPKKKRANSFL